MSVTTEHILSYIPQDHIIACEIILFSILNMRQADQNCRYLAALIQSKEYLLKYLYELSESSNIVKYSKK